MLDMKEEHRAADRLVHAYDRMLQRVRQLFEEGGKHAGPTLKDAVERARDRATELNELSREEADRVADYLKRDLHDTAEFLATTGKEFRQWARFDLSLVEDRLLEAFANVADQTTLELRQLEQQADLMGEWHTGEVTGIGTLRCVACGEEMHFHGTGRIPPCPRCRKTIFRRVRGEE